MLLVAGGHLDPNIGRLLRRVLERKIPCVDLLVGPANVPRVEVTFPNCKLLVSGAEVQARSAFLRHDAFWHDERNGQNAQVAALNWYHLVRGWARGSGVAMFNVSARASENSKLENLVLAAQCGLFIPQTIAANDLCIDVSKLGNEVIVKPLAGGQLTRTHSEVLKNWDGSDPLQSYPRFLQPRLGRPEIRAYLVGSEIHAFSLNSEDLDYRERHRAVISLTGMPSSLDEGLRKLCGKLGLDFAAADFMLREDGEYCFLEINAQPMFYAFDLVAEGRLVDSILDWLISCR